MPTYNDIEMAFDYVSSSPYGTNRVVYDKTADRLLYASELSDESEIPDDIDPDQCIEVPHQHDLDLGRDLVFRFIAQTLPEDEATVRRIFARPGAYARFKELLERRQRLQQWSDFEAAALRKAIEQWCQDNQVNISQATVGTPQEPAS